MRWIANSVRAVATIAALLLVAPSSEAQMNQKQSAQATKLTAATKTNPQSLSGNIKRDYRVFGA